MKKNLLWSKGSDRQLIVNQLQDGNVVLGTSDTVLGLLADTTARGTSLLNEIKGRDRKPYIILIESKEKASYFVEQSDLTHYQKLLDSCWPGPLTLIFRAKANLPDYIKGINGTVALRVPKHEGLLAILGQFNGLFSTSANLSGQPVPNSIEEVDPQLINRVSLIVTEDPSASYSKAVIPSTILDLTGSQIKMIREGAYSKEEIEKILGINI